MVIIYHGIRITTTKMEEKIKQNIELDKRILQMKYIYILTLFRFNIHKHYIYIYIYHSIQKRFFLSFFLNNNYNK